MAIPVVALTTGDHMRDYVRKTLCDHDRLDPGQTPIFGALIQRSNRACGMLFHIEGPRLLRTSAVWSGEEHRILFYDSTGVRFHEVRLSESPTPEELVPAPTGDSSRTE
jgi:hypothetical protein